MCCSERLHICLYQLACLTKDCLNTLMALKFLQALLHCRRLTWMTVLLCELIHCRLEQLLAPLRIPRPCKTQSLCWKSGTNELLNISPSPWGKKQEGLMEQFNSGVGREEHCQVWNAKWTLSQQHIFCSLRSILNHVFDCKKIYSDLSFCAFGHIQLLVLLELTRHLGCIVIQRGARRGVGTWSKA